MKRTTVCRWPHRSLGLLAVLLGGCATSGRMESDSGSASGTETDIVTWDFDGDPPEQVPMGWSIRETNPTEARATWQVIKDRSAPSPRNVMALTDSRNYDGTFNLAIVDGSSFTDLDLSVRVKAISGKEDQGGGPIWRCRDEDNYYICRFNPLEGNYRLYVVRNDRRKQLESVKFNSQPGRWYTVRVTMIGDRITCYLDGRKLLEAKDDTFGDAGMVGLWTKADAVASFDDLEVRPLDTE